jgi:hypothetical protein
MFENIYVGNKLVSVLKGEHYGEVIRDAMTGDIIVIEHDKIVALGCTADASEHTIEFWENKLHNKISFRLSKEVFRDTGLNKAVVLPPKLSKRKIDEPSPMISVEEEMYYLRKDLERASKIIDNLRDEVNNKDQRIKTMTLSLRIISKESSRY